MNQDDGTKTSSEDQVANYLQRFRPVLLTLAEAMISPWLRKDLEASDLVQHTLMEAHCSSVQLRSIDERQVFAWLRNALRHNVLDAIRRVRTQKHDERRTMRLSDLGGASVNVENFITSSDTSPSQWAQRNEQIRIMLAAIQELPENQRFAIIMKHLRGHSLKEVAAALELSESATAGLLHRGRQELSRHLRGNAS